MPALEKYQYLMTTEQKLYFQSEYDKQTRSPSTALLLCLLLGGLGAHRFYLRQVGWGVVYVLFSWTFIPVIVSLIECFLIQKRTRLYDEEIEQSILTKLGIIFGSAPSQPAGSPSAPDCTSTEQVGSQMNSFVLNAYATLGLTPEANMETVDLAYQRLLAQYDPEATQHLAAEINQIAMKKTTEIRVAYSFIRAAGPCA